MIALMPRQGNLAVRVPARLTSTAVRQARRLQPDPVVNGKAGIKATELSRTDKTAPRILANSAIAAKPELTNVKLVPASRAV